MSRALGQIHAVLLASVVLAAVAGQGATSSLGYAPAYAKFISLFVGIFQAMLATSRGFAAKAAFLLSIPPFVVFLAGSRDALPSPALLVVVAIAEFGAVVAIYRGTPQDNGD